MRVHHRRPTPICSRMKKLEELIRPNVRALLTRLPASPETQRPEGVISLDRNESPYNAPYNRYPAAERRELLAEASLATGIRPECIFAGSGAWDIFDLLLRTFCRPGTDNVIAPTPVSEGFARLAALNDVAYRSVPLGPRFELQADRLLEAADERSKIIFICSPNNPTGNLADAEEIVRTADAFPGLVVVDETYLAFSSAPSLRRQPSAHPNLIVVSSMSQAWASAGLRVALAFARPETVALLDRVRPPHNISAPSLRLARETLRRNYSIFKWNSLVADERRKVMAAFTQLPFCTCVYPSEANFFLARLKGAKRIYRYLAAHGIAVKDCSAYDGCADCLRIGIALPHENTALLSAMRKYDPETEEEDPRLP